MDAKVCQGDSLAWMLNYTGPQVDLVFGSPPYEDLRPYGTDFRLAGEAWVKWMVSVVAAAVRICRGPVAFVVEGKTENYRWSGTPDLLSADLIRAGYTLRKPVAYCRFGIAGASPDYFKNTWEKVIVVTPPGRLVWSDPTACGGSPKYAPGGAMSHRSKTGARVDGKRRPYRPPSKTNPGTCYDPAVTGEVAPDRIWCAVGGGHMGHPEAANGQAPFTLGLAERFVRTFCPPGGTVLDPFGGTGTTAHAALLHGRNSVSVDIDPEQCVVMERRLADVRANLKSAVPTGEKRGEAK